MKTLKQIGKAFGRMAVVGTFLATAAGLFGTVADASAELLLDGESVADTNKPSEGPPYTAIKAKQTGDRGFFSTPPQTVATREFDTILSDIAELEFSQWCAFNGHGSLASDGRDRSHDFPCLAAPGYVAVYLKGQVKLFKISRGRMIEQLAFTFYANERYRIVDFDAVRKAFDIQTRED